MLWAKACAECCAERAAGRCVRCLCCNADVLGGITCVVVQLGIRDCLSKIWRRCGVVKRDPLCRAMGHPSWQARMREPRLRRQVSQCTYIEACYLEETRMRQRTVVHGMKDGCMKRSTRARAHHDVWGDRGLWAGVWVWEAISLWLCPPLCTSSSSQPTRRCSPCNLVFSPRLRTCTDRTHTCGGAPTGCPAAFQRTCLRAPRGRR